VFTFSGEDHTYFDGDAAFCDKATRGRSKDKRNDRPLLTLGIVVGENGFLKTSRVYEGNISEPATLMDMVHDIQGHTVGQQLSLPVEHLSVVLDVGITSEDNLKTLKEQGFAYIVISRSKPPEIAPSNFTEIKKGIKAHSFKIDDEIFLHCLNEAKTKKRTSHGQ
jgi:transposase